MSKLRGKFHAELIGRTTYLFTTGILTIILARILSPNDYGILFLVISILAFARIAAILGIPRSTSKYIIEYLEDDNTQIPHIIRFSFILVMITSILVSSLIYLFHGYIAYFVGEPDIAILLSIGGIYLVSISLFRYSRITLQGFNQIGQGTVIYGLNGVLKLTVTVSLVSLGYGILGAFVGYIIAYALSAAIGLYFIYKILTKYKKSKLIEPNLRKRILKYSIPTAITQSASTIDKRVDIIIVGYFLSPVQVGLYVISKQIVNFVGAPAAALGFSTSPTYAQEKSSGRTEDSAKTYITIFSNTLLLYIPGAVGLFLVSEVGVIYIFGVDYVDAASLVQVFTIYIILQSIARISSNGLDMIGKATHRSIAKLTMSLSNVILNIILIPIIGVIGAAFATVTTHFGYTLYLVYLITNELQINYVQLTKPIIRAGGISLLMGLAVYPATMYFVGVYALIIPIIIGVSIWLISLRSFNISTLYF